MVSHCFARCTRRGDDAGIVLVAMELARSLHAEAKPLGSGGFVGVHTRCYTRFVCASTVKLRDPPIVVFAECRLSIDDQNLLSVALQRLRWFLKPAMPPPEMQHTHAEAAMRLP